MPRIELAFAQDGFVFVLARLPPEPCPDDGALEWALDIAGRPVAIAGRHQRAGDLLLIAAPLPDRPPARAPVRLRLGPDISAEARLGRDRVAFDRMAAAQAPLLRRLLDRLPRTEFYAVEAIAWPATAARDEYADLARLDRDLGVELDIVCVPLPGILLAIAWHDDPARAVTSIDVFHGQDDTPFERHLLRFERPDPPPTQRDRLRPSAAIAVVLAFDEARIADDDFVLMLATRTALWTGSLRPRGRLERGLRALEPQLRRFDPNVQLMLLEAIADLAVTETLRDGERTLLRALHEAAIAQLPEDISRGDLGVRIGLDLACTVGRAGVFLLGWSMLEEAAGLGEAEAIVAFRTGASGRHDISPGWVTNARLDVWQRLRAQALHPRTDRLGFICFVPTEVDALTTGYLAVTAGDGRSFRMRVTLYFSAEDPLDAIKPVLTSFAQTHHDLGPLLDRHVGPAVTAVWASRRGGPTGIDVRSYGTPATAPEASIVIPLFGRCDFLEFQVAAFADDADLRRHEVIFVVDDPPIHDAALRLAEDVHRIFRFPFRLAYGRRNLGFAGATNLGAGLARGDFILMMNSDVLPRRDRWLSDLVAAHRSLPAPGAVAPVLLYDDGSLQHAGMQFARYPLWASMWVNEHPGKGLPKLPMTNPFEAVAVTGACLMMAAPLWRDIGGLSDAFIIGDFEDSDLCMRLRARGLRNWVVPAVELTHLERQSQDLVGEPAWRTNLTLFNCWTHHRRWDAAITAAAAAP